MQLEYLVKELASFDNSGFSRIEVSVMYEGLNRNGSIFAAEAVQTIIDSLPGAPIVGFFDGEDFTDHEKIGSFDEETEEFLITTKTKPYGFITQEKPQVKEIDGKDYIVAEGLLWTKRYPEAALILDEKSNQSMEIEPSTLQMYHIADGVPVITHAEIAALCILGQKVVPAFEKAQFVREGFLEFMLKAQGASLEEKEEVLVSVNKDIPAEIETVVDFEESTVETEEVLTETEETATETEEVLVEEIKVEEEEALVEEIEIEDEEALIEEIEIEDEEALIEEIKTAEEKLSIEPIEVDPNEALMAELEALRVFKHEAERNEKLSAINRDIYSQVPAQFKEEVVANIDNYTLGELEGKLALKALEIGFSASVKTETPIVTSVVSNTNTEPAWVSAVRNHSKK